MCFLKPTLCQSTHISSSFLINISLLFRCVLALVGCFSLTNIWSIKATKLISFKSEVYLKKNLIKIMIIISNKTLYNFEKKKFLQCCVLVQSTFIALCLCLLFLSDILCLFLSEAQAFVTLATTDAYCMGCIVVGKSLRRHGTSRKLVVMVSPNVSRVGR